MKQIMRNFRGTSPIIADKINIYLTNHSNYIIQNVIKLSMTEGQDNVLVIFNVEGEESNV